MNDRIAQGTISQTSKGKWFALTLVALGTLCPAVPATAQDAYRPSYAFPEAQPWLNQPRPRSASRFSPAFRPYPVYQGSNFAGQNPLGSIPPMPVYAGADYAGPVRRVPVRTVVVPGPILLAPGEEPPIIISPEQLPPPPDFPAPAEFPPANSFPAAEPTEPPPAFTPAPQPTPVMPRLRPVPYRVERVTPATELPSPDVSPLQMFVTEGFVGQLLGGERTTTGEVEEVILKANVTGTQTTVTRVRADFRPNANMAEVLLQLDGECHSDTLGCRKAACIATEGRHTFQGTKEITFDGELLRTRAARVKVQPFNRTLGAQTKLDGVPMLDEMARQIAFNQAEKLRPQSEAIAAEKLGTRTAREFNENVDKQLAAANQALLKRSANAPAEAGAEAVSNPMKALWPESLRFSTTDTHLVCRANWALPQVPVAPAANLVSFSSGAGNAGPAARIVPTADSATLYVHDSLLNAGIRQANLAGGGYTEQSLMEMTEGLATRLGGRVLPAQEQAPANPLASTFEATLRFDDKEPLHLEFGEGRMTARIRTSIEVGGRVVITSRDIFVPFELKFEEDLLRLIPGKVTVSATDPNSIDLPGLGNGLLEGRIQAAVREMEFPRSLSLPMAAVANRAIRVDQVKADAGWLMLNLVWAPAPAN